MCAWRTATHWFTAVLRFWLFSEPEWSSRAGPSSVGGVDYGFILLYRFSLSELLRRPPAPRLSAPELYLPGFLPYPRFRRSASTVREACLTSLRSVLRFSRPLDGLLRLRFAGLFHPATTPRVFPFRDLFPIRSACRLVAGSCPRAVGPPLLHCSSAVESNGPLTRRNEPASTSGHPDFEASFHGSIARLRVRFRSAVSRIPSAGSSSSRCSPSGS